MYENKIGMATLGGHGIGAKIALAAACYHHEHVTGYFGLDSTPMNQFYHEAFADLRNSVNALSGVSTQRSYSALSNSLKEKITCPYWRTRFLNNLVKGDHGYEWNFNFEAVHHNLTK